jgi:pimeloyl-ACP methyl ester carboxylesterase
MGNPIDTLAALKAKDISLIYVVGDDDDVVPVAENSDIVEKRYRELGGDVKVIRKPKVGHHPHGLDDPTPVVEYICEKIKKHSSELK